MTRPASLRVTRRSWRNCSREGSFSTGERILPEETAVALTYNGGTQAVMMATPADLEDFAIGFSLTEGIVEAASQIEALDIVEEPLGLEVRMWLPEHRARALGDRRRQQAGPTGCGLCGIESLSEALRPSPVVTAAWRIAPSDVTRAIGALAPRQVLNHETRAVHAAAFWQPGADLLAVREDVGRHNALDKLIGALAQADIDAASGMLLLTSRVSVELVQKAAVAGVPVLVAVSAPTGLAVRSAEAAGITLVAIARDDGFEVFTHPDRVTDR